jgi:hypothetical protein
MAMPKSKSVWCAVRERVRVRHRVQVREFESTEHGSRVVPRGCTVVPYLACRTRPGAAGAGFAAS